QLEAGHSGHTVIGDQGVDIVALFEDGHGLLRGKRLQGHMSLFGQLVHRIERDQGIVVHNQKSCAASLNVRLQCYQSFRPPRPVPKADSPAASTMFPPRQKKWQSWVPAQNEAS